MSGKQSPRSFFPETSGSLCGLCGVYASVNVLRAYFGGAPGSEQSEQDFLRLCAVLDGRGGLGRFLGLGTRWRDQLALSKEVIAIARERGKPLERIIVSKASGELSLPQYWKRMTNLIKSGGDGGVAIIGVSGKTEHWTCAIDITPKQLVLADSSYFNDTQSLPRHRCTVGEPKGARHYKVFPNETIVFVPKK